MKFAKFKHIFLKYHFQLKKRKIKEFYSIFINDGDLCFDIGANEGNIADIFLQLKANVIAIEPQNTCIQKMQKRFKNNKNIIILGKGVSDIEGKELFFECIEANTISSFADKWKEGRFSNYNWTNGNELYVTTLDRIIRMFGLPKYCKIDVEGYEKKVILGLTQRIPYLSFEFTHELLEDTKFWVVTL
jgi:FkbM family methyltransferase